MFTNTSVFSSYSVDDLEEALDFYRKILELEVEETHEGLKIRFENGSTLFMYPKVDHAPATFTVLNFVVASIDDTVRLLSIKDIKFEKYDTKDIQTDDKGVFRGKASGNGPDVAWFKDPAGNIISIIEE